MAEIHYLLCRNLAILACFQLQAHQAYHHNKGLMEAWGSTQ